MANRYAVATGNWSNTATWDGGTLPQAGDVVRPNGYTVTIDQNVTVTELRNDASSPAVAGGGFVLSESFTVTANITKASSSTLLNISGSGSRWITGNISSIVSSSNSAVIVTTSTINVTGNINGGGGIGNSNHGISLNGSAVLNLVGNAISWSATQTYQVYAISVTAGSIVNMTGNCVGGNHNDDGAPAILNSGGNVTVTGNITSASTCRGITNTGTLEVIGNLNGFSTGIIIHNTGTFIFTGVVNIASSGGQPWFGNYPIVRPSGYIELSFRAFSGVSNVSERRVYSGGQNLGQPTASNVRQGVIFGVSNEYTGTLAVPPAGSVALGVPVDNTTGTGLINQTVLQAALEAALAPNAANIVERSTNDNKAITFSWPVSGATITGQKSIDNGAYSAVAGAITFLRTESNRHYYSLAYNAADRNTVESSIRYKMTDGTYTKYFNLHVVPSGDVNVTVSPLTAEQEPRNTRSRIIVYTGEGGTQYFYAIDSAGNSLNLTGFNLELRFAKGKSVIYTAKTSDGSLTVSNNNQVTFTRSAALTRGDGELTYALRNMGAGEEVLLDGPVTVRYAP